MKKILLVSLLVVFTFSLNLSTLSAATTTLTTQKQVLALFKSAMGNRWSVLSSKATGQAGAKAVTNFILPQADGGNNDVIGITFAQVNEQGVLAKTTYDKLLWFKDQFSLNDTGELTDPDLLIIGKAMKLGMIDLKIAAFQAIPQVKSHLTTQKAYIDHELNGKTVLDNPTTTDVNEAWKSLITRRKEAINVCKAEYKSQIQTLSNTYETFADSAGRLLYNSQGKYFKNLELVKDRDNCISQEWIEFFSAVTELIEVGRSELSEKFNSISPENQVVHEAWEQFNEDIGVIQGYFTVSVES